MTKRKEWNCQPFNKSETVSDLRHALIIAQLAELIYNGISSRELPSAKSHSIVTRSEELQLKSEGKVTNEVR
jgi:hypothetical protein